MGKIFLKIDQSMTYSNMLQYLIMKNFKLNKDIKYYYYQVLNKSSDDQSKGQILSLL